MDTGQSCLVGWDSKLQMLYYKQQTGILNNNKSISKTQKFVHGDHSKCTHVYTYTYTYTHTHRHTHMQTHTHTHTHTHMGTCLHYSQLTCDLDIIVNKGLRQWKTAAWEWKTWQVYCFEKRNVLRLDLLQSKEGFFLRGRGRSFHSHTAICLCRELLQPLLAKQKTQWAHWWLYVQRVCMSEKGKSIRKCVI